MLSDVDDWRLGYLKVFEKRGWGVQGSGAVGVVWEESMGRIVDSIKPLRDKGPSQTRVADIDELVSGSKRK